MKNILGNITKTARWSRMLNHGYRQLSLRSTSSGNSDSGNGVGLFDNRRSGRSFLKREELLSPPYYPGEILILKLYPNAEPLPVEIIKQPVIKNKEPEVTNQLPALTGEPQPVKKHSEKDIFTKEESMEVLNHYIKSNMFTTGGQYIDGIIWALQQLPLISRHTVFLSFAELLIKGSGVDAFTRYSPDEIKQYLIQCHTFWKKVIAEITAVQKNDIRYFLFNNYISAVAKTYIDRLPFIKTIIWP